MKTTTINVQKTFNIESDWQINALIERSEFVPDIDDLYHFDHQTTLSILAGFEYNRRVLIQGLHGTGKSTHLEQVAARLNWPCMRVNLDGNINRLDLIGKDTLNVVDGKTSTQYQMGIIPWALQQPMALIFDEYDAGRPEIMFIIQRLLEADGKFTLPDGNKVITAHPQFRLFATSNTLGLGNIYNLYHGTHRLNHAQLDRWNIVSSLNHLSPDQELQVVKAKVSGFRENSALDETLKGMIAVANLTRQGLKNGDLTTLMSPRTVISWAENHLIFNDLAISFRLAYLNKCDESERSIVAEYYQRMFNQELPESMLSIL